ncbi:hypothetical protein ACKFKG_06695 [Phormidesmis sp. 146-35]
MSQAPIKTNTSEGNQEIQIKTVELFAAGAASSWCRVWCLENGIVGQGHTQHTAIQKLKAAINSGLMV